MSKLLIVYPVPGIDRVLVRTGALGLSLDYEYNSTGVVLSTFETDSIISQGANGSIKPNLICMRMKRSPETGEFVYKQTMQVFAYTWPKYDALSKLLSTTRTSIRKTKRKHKYYETFTVLQREREREREPQ